MNWKEELFRSKCHKHYYKETAVINLEQFLEISAILTKQARVDELQKFTDLCLSYLNEDLGDWDKISNIHIENRIKELE